MLNDLEKLASQVRRDILRMVHGAQSGHPGGSLGCTDFLVALYGAIMNHSPQFNPDGENEDLFFLSNGHVSPVWYSVLARMGYFEVAELKTFRKINSRLQGHPATEEGLEGIRIASGSLGQGLSVAIGAALSKKLNQDKYLVYALLGDGELQEGQIWEAAMFAAHKQVDNLIVTVDYNGQQIDGATADVMNLGNLKAKWEAFGWTVVESQGNDLNSILKTVAEAKTLLQSHSKPVVNLMQTEMGYGVDFMMGSHKWHGIPPNDEQLQKGLDQLKETLGDY